MTADKLDEAFNEAEAEQLERIGREFTEYAATANAAWRQRWPNHCQACGGWGSIPFAQHEAEILSVPCEALEPGACHRCGQDGLDPESGGGPCRACGWNFDDGVR
jgi:hypothetical protein